MNALARSARILVSLAAFLGLIAWLTGAAAAQGSAGAVYTSTNQVAGNAVAVFDRGADGTLTPAGHYPTGGLGTGGGLGNQGALALSNGGRFLFVVNAGSNDISAFRVTAGGLALVDRIDSGGVSPISLTADADLLYVLNAGAAGSAGNISGFRVGSDGSLDAIAGSTRPLSAAAVGPAQIQFDPSGDTLVVTEKATSSIDTYVVGSNGTVSGPTVEASSGQTPFGFAFDKRGHLIVSEAFGGAASALSSYDVGDDGALSVISPSVVAASEQASCWVVTTGKFAYTTNTGTGSISGYAIGHDGSLSLLDADGRTGVTGGAPIDAALSRNDRFLYALNASTRRIDAFRIESDGSLIALPGAGIGGLPAGVNGLVAT